MGAHVVADGETPTIQTQATNAGRPRITDAPTSIAAFVGRTHTGPTGPVLCDGLDDFERVFGGITAGSDLPQSVQLFFLNGGSQAIISRVDNGDAHGAIDRLTDADAVNFLSVLSPRPGRDVAMATWVHAKAWCEENDALLLVDPPEHWTGPEEAARLEGGYAQLAGPNTLIYFPRVEAADPLGRGNRRFFAPSGAIAGLFARTDVEHGVWRSAAGLHAGLRGVTGVEYQGPSVAAARLNAAAVNSVRTLSGSGTVVWGGRTSDPINLDRSRDWKYVSVRRLALFIQQSIERSMGWAVFEPNASALWAEITHSVEEFMHGLHRRGAFAGTRPEDSWRVSCGSLTTRPSDLDAGVARVTINFAPLRPAEFVTVDACVLAGPAPVAAGASDRNSLTD